MEKIIYFDYSAAAVVTLLAISIYMRKLTKGRLNRYFMSLLVLLLLTIVADIYAITLDNLGPGYVVEKYISHTAYLLLHNFMTPVYINYLVALVDGWHVIRRRKILPFLFAAPFAVVVVACVTNIWTGHLFYLGEADNYTRGPIFIILYICTMIYFVTGVWYLCYYSKIFRRDRFLSLMSMFFLMLGAVILQALFPSMPVEMLANALSLSFISMVVQKPEELIDVNTKLLKANAYFEDMNKAYFTEKKCTVIMLNIINYNSLFGMLGIDTMETAMETMAEKLQSINEINKLWAEIYYLGNGQFRLIFSREKRNVVDTYKVAELINNEFKDALILPEFEVNLVLGTYIVNVPEDASDNNSMLAISREIYKEDESGIIRRAADFVNQDRHNMIRDIDSIIEKALVNRNFEVYYQPIYSTEKKCFNSAEALLRLKDDKYGFVPPDIFITAAEKNGLIHKIGAFVLDEVCNFIASPDFTRTGLEYIEVNLSVTQCMRPDMADEVLGILEKYDISPSCINLEITETATSFSQTTLEENLRALTEKGITFSLDDFGTGYSNMQRIASLPFYIVKLDKIFTKLDGNPNLEIILKNSIRMIKDMNMKIVIEGIETNDSRNTFTELGCDYIQGYYFSKPIPKNQFVDFLLENANK